jgi:hypothetical protein
VGTPQVKGKHRRVARRRRPRPRICLRKGCRRKYQPRRWNQRYCQDPHCQREVKRWQAARRQAKRRQEARVKARHAQAEKQRRHRAKTTPKAIENPEVAPARGHAAKIFFPLPFCDRPGCYEPRVTSPRNPARYCCATCRQAVRNVRDRERKWLARGTLDGRTKRTIEYQAARRNRSLQKQITAAEVPPRAPPQ